MCSQTYTFRRIQAGVHTGRQEAGRQTHTDTDTHRHTHTHRQTHRHTDTKFSTSTHAVYTAVRTVPRYCSYSRTAVYCV